MQNAPAAPSLKHLALDASVSRTYYSIAEVAALLGVSRVSVWRWISSGRLPVTRLGHRTVRVKREDVDLMARSSRPGAPEPPSPADSPRPGEGVRPGAADHFVMFYEADRFLVDGVADFIGPALTSGERAIVVATAAHRASIEDRLRSIGLDMHQAIADGHYVAVDAAQTLARFMVAGWPDPTRFGEVLGGLLRGSAASVGRPRIFGEMVALLTGEGKPAEALALEGMWNQQAKKHTFALMCAYPMPQMVGESLSSALVDVCAEHSTVIPTETYSVLGDTDARLRAIAALQQRAASLEREIAERRRAEDQLQAALAAERAARADAEAALRVREEFLSIASHELRTPITILGAQAQLSLRRLERAGELDPERISQALRSMGTQADKLGRLVNQLLDVARLEGGKFELELKPTNIVRLADQVVSASRSLLATGKHAIGLTAPAAVECEIDALRIEQVLTNLIDNAFKYSPWGGQVDVAVTLPDAELVEVSVRDHGLGIPHDKRGQIFERFYQAHDTSYRSGMGLG
ncbi:MAG: MEDS domain-containing protein, partial [Chloroflexi bacterium]|nr:MEDS domain-containing protein [Chloroflexota bacterium]